MCINMQKMKLHAKAIQSYAFSKLAAFVTSQTMPHS